jgi:hypothetical protein
MFEMNVFSILSGYQLEMLKEDDENGAIVNYMCPEGGCNFSAKFCMEEQNNPRGMSKLVA